MRTFKRGGFALALIALVSLLLAPFPAAANEPSPDAAGLTPMEANPTLPPTDCADCPLLDGEQLTVSNSMGGEFDITGTTAGEFSCGSTSDLTVDIAGNAYGPYPGTFSESLHAQIVDGMVTVFDVTFTINSGATTVSGSASYTGPGTEANCSVHFDEDDGWIYRFSVGSGGGGYEPLQLDQTSTIDDGSESTPDAGHIQAGVNFSCLGSPVFTSNCDVATTVLDFGEATPPPPPPGDGPTVTSVDFPSSFENGPDPATVTVTVGMTSDIGVRDGLCEEQPPEEGGGTICSGSQVTFAAPRGSASAIGWLTSVGDDLYEANVIFPPYAAVGAWSLFVGAVDLDYNSAYLGPDDLDGAGFASSIEVTGTDDVTPPEVQAISALSTDHINVNDPEYANRLVEADIQVADDLSGVYSVVPVFESTLGDAYYASSDPLGGGVYHAMADFNQPYLIGNWSLSYVVVEDVLGNTATYSPDSPRDFEVVAESGATLPAGGTLESPDNSDGQYRVTTAITSPNGGVVSVVSSVSDSAPDGFSLLGYELDISAPAATATQPLVLRFELHRFYLSPDLELADVQLFRNGVQLPDCGGAPGVASPDPCVSDRSWTSEGNISITALTSHASTWLLADGPPVAQTGTAALVTGIQNLPASSLKARGNREAFLSRLSDTQAAIDRGDSKAATKQLANLRQQVDGCGIKADKTDWIVECSAQVAVRAMIDDLLAALSG